MSRLIITILSAGVITLVSASCVKAQDDDRLAKFVPTELWACNYNEGQGPDDLDVVAGKWNAYMDENEADAYLAWTLTPQYFTDEQDFDVLWLGAWKNGNEMGQGRDNYHATGGAIMAEFGKVIDCGAHLGFVSRAFKLPPDDDAGPSNTGVITLRRCSATTAQRARFINGGPFTAVAVRLRWTSNCSAFMPIMRHSALIWSAWAMASFGAKGWSLLAINSTATSRASTTQG